MTPEATDAAGGVHPRTPLTVAPDNIAHRLDPSLQDPEEITGLLADPAARPLDVRPVSTHVNKPGVNNPDLLEEVDAATQGDD
ncbi:SOS response-associated peptidase [Streptomyces cocklensis]|nr:SOS response-associated peptidase [Actinacidiphila cocklensis]